MTSSSLSSARNIAFMAAAAAFVLSPIAGCDPGDGKKEYADAQAAYKVKNFDKAAMLFERAATLDTKNVDALVMLVRTHLDLGDVAAAEDALHRAEALAPDDNDVAELSAQCAWYSKRYDEAREKYKKLADDISKEPALRAQAFSALGLVDMALSDLRPRDEWLRDRARVEFLQAIAIDKRCAPARYHLGILYRDDPFGYKEAALAQFEAFKQLAPVADPRLDKVLRTTIPELKEEINRQIAESPGAANRDSSAASEALRKAESAWNHSQYKTARKNYEAAFKADPLSFQAALGLAKAIEKTEGNTPAARRRAYDAYFAACHLRSSAVSTFITTADLAFRLEKYSSAAELYSRAVAASARDITAIDGLIRSLAKCDRKRAASVYQQYRDTIPVRRK